jgi:Tol biopolymer transport system component/DNA-binding winged helix-turn-helix (wHTH) protein
MRTPAGSRRLIRFGEFHLDLDTAELRNNGNRTSLVGQPLQILTELLERPGHLVTREELKKKLWPDDTFVDFDQSLNKAVNRLREALKDSAEHPRFIETLPRRGYRFIGSFDSPERRLVSPGDELPIRTISPEPAAQNLSNRGRKTLVLGIAAAFVTLSAMLLALEYRSSRALTLRVIGSTRLTNDGWRKFALVTDGVRLYFSGKGTIKQSSVDGGEETEVQTGLKDLDIYDISPHGSALLVGTGVQGSPTVERPVWIVSLPGGTPIQVGNIKALWAAWTPDGEHLAYSTNDGVFAARIDGTENHKLANVRGTPWKLQYSPDGSRIRFDALDTKRNLAAIWEMRADGTNLRLLFPELDRPLHTGAWSSDSKYFFFNSHEPEKDRDEDVWVSTESGTAAHRAPVRLTHESIVFGYPVPSPDGKKLYALGTQSRAELVRLDRGLKKFVPYLSGISASEASRSRDGQWVAYVSFPELTLWRSKADGTEKRQLTFPPFQVVRPRWSPDGARIAFTDVRPGKTWKIYVISSEGGAPQEISAGDTHPEIDPSWSPDGDSIIFGGSIGEPRGILRIDLKSKAVLTLPGSEGLFSPQMSSDGRYVSAFPTDASKLMLYDLKSGKWVAMAEGIFQFNTWSRDSKKIYLLSFDGVYKIVRFDVSSKRFEPVVSLEGIEQGARGWIGLDEAENPMLVLDKSITEVYRLDLRVP